MRIHVDVSRVERTFKRLARELSSDHAEKIAAQIISEEVEDAAKSSFAKQADPVSGARWKKRKGNVDPGRAILIKSGSLRRGISVETDVRPGKAVISGVVVGSASDYALKHQEGLGVTRRRYMGLSEERWRRALKRIVDRLKLGG